MLEPWASAEDHGAIGGCGVGWETMAFPPCFDQVSFTGLSHIADVGLNSTQACPVLKEKNGTGEMA